MKKLTIKETVIFGMLGGVMYISKLMMEAVPNVHLLGAFIVSITLVYRAKALYPIYIYVLLEGLFNGFTTWWIPNLYIWLPLWGATMLLPKKMPKIVAPIVYCAVSTLHGLCYGTLYAPFQALAYGMNFEGMMAWIVSGLPFDVMHAVGNLAASVLILPLAKLYRICDKNSRS